MSNSTIKEKSLKANLNFSAKNVAQKSVSYADAQVDNGIIYWTQSNPQEPGRNVIVSYDTQNKLINETPNTFNVSTSVHGYGGGAFLAKNGCIYFYDSISKQVYKKHKEHFNQLTNEEGFSYGDFCVDSNHKFLYGLRLHASQTEIVRIEIETKTQEILATGADFYSNVRLNELDNKILFLQWNNPNMPWDENELWTLDLDSKKLCKVFHKPRVSIYQPQWHRDSIICANDSTGYWNLCLINEHKVEFLFQAQIDFARPLWLAATQSFAFIGENKILATGCEKGVWKTFLVNFNVANSFATIIRTPLSTINTIAADKDRVVYIGGNAEMEMGVFVSSTQVLEHLVPVYPSKNQFKISTPQHIEFHGIHALYYAPQEQNVKNPPCIIKIHGGPTTNADVILNSKIQYFTQQGFAYVEINYRGSSGYGREYREALNKKWGLVDAQDCISCAHYLIQEGLADKNNLILTGSSAGGFTLLHVLAKTDLFKCASCHYGVTDLTQLAQQIHKFEACYDQNLIGDTTQYKERSPISVAQNIKTPVLFFHGDKDPVVPMSQSLTMSKLLKNSELYIFEGEGHGFKKEETIITVLEKELKFFKK